MDTFRQISDNSNFRIKFRGVVRPFLIVRKITARGWRAKPRKLMDFSRFDDLQNSFSEPTVYWHYVVNILFLDLFQIHDSMTYWFSIQYSSSGDDLGINIFTRYHFSLTSKSEFHRKICILCQEVVVENITMEWYKNWRYGIIVHETTRHLLYSIQVEGL